MKIERQQHQWDGINSSIHFSGHNFKNNKIDKLTKTFFMFQKIRKWSDGSPLTIQRFSSAYSAGRFVCGYSLLYNFQIYDYFPWCLGHKKIIENFWTGSTAKNLSKCFFMFLHNLAEPDWFSVDCDKPLLSQVICVKESVHENAMDINNRSVENNYFCISNAILVGGMCYEFHWTSGISKIKYSKDNFTVNIMIFKHIFETIALENQFLSAFLQKNILKMNAVKFLRYLDTVTFKQNIVSFPDQAGYIIYPSNESVIQLGIHIFNCSQGGHILFKYICNGIKDCPNDRSDEDFCTCGESMDLKMCKTGNNSKYLNTCSSVYYMVKNGYCLKYTDPVQIYNVFNITDHLPKYRKKRTSKLIILKKSITAIGQKEFNEETYFSTVNLLNYHRCFNPGEVPCLEGYFQCYNITSICIYQLNTYNITLIPCENGRHLEYCKTFSCDTMFKCLNNYCVPWAYVCDGKWDCPKGEDELDVLVCNKHIICKIMYHCQNTRQMCLHLGNICDGYFDCPFGDDELLCELKSVECPSFCVCLLYAIQCRGLSDENIEKIYPFHYMSVHISNFKLNSMTTLIPKLKYAIVLKLPSNEIRDVCDIFSKFMNWKCMVLDLSFNSLNGIENRCYSSTRSLKMLTINDNNITFVARYSFIHLSNLKFLSLKNNPIIHLHSSFFIHLFHLKLLSIVNVSFHDINPESFSGSKIKFIYTEDYHICCTVPFRTVCTAFQPWYISCSDILPSLSTKTFYISISLLIFILNSFSIILQITKCVFNKAFSITAIMINANDILCGIYLSLIWIADISYSGSFHVKEESWRSGLFCILAFTTALWFTVLSELTLMFMSLARLMVTISPLYTRFKETPFIVRSLSFLIFFSLIFSTCIALIFKITEGNLTISLCLPFVDPTGSKLLIKMITWFCVLSQFATSVGIMSMHFILVVEIRRSQKNIQKSKQNCEVPLLIQLVMITASNILCWYPTGCVYISAVFLSTYPIDLVIWTTVIGLPINSIINPCILISTTVRKKRKFKPKVFTAGNAYDM